MKTTQLDNSGYKKMDYFKIILETGKKKSTSRIMYIRAVNAVDAMLISNKVRGARLVSIHSITYEDYMKGVDKKYTSNLHK